MLPSDVSGGNVPTHLGPVRTKSRSLDQRAQVSGTLRPMHFMTETDSLSQTFRLKKLKAMDNDRISGHRSTHTHTQTY